MTFTKKKISCIIPAYNEESRVGNVLNAVKDYFGFDEVIVIDDGSTDGTYEEISKFVSKKVKIIRHKENKGKAEALFTGFKKSRGDVIVFLDADLVGITHRNLDDLIEPFKYFDCMTLGRWNGFYISIELTGIPVWSGMRAIPRNIFKELTGCKNSGYAVESYINRAVLKNNLPVCVVDWRNVDHIRKVEKDYWIGVRENIKMDVGVFTQISVLESIYQLLIFYKINKKTQVLLNKYRN
jgi:glycosyltransferase involved in cell wall biosynthesis